MASLRELRRARGITQVQLAATAGVSNILVSEVELGKRRPYEETARALAVAIGATLEDVEWPAGLSARKTPDPEPASITCKICGQSFPMPASHAGRNRRCSACVKAGRARCAGCGQEIKVTPRTYRPVLCGNCLSVGGIHFHKKDHVTVRCRGISAFGGSHHPNCRVTYRFSPAQTRQRKSYQEAAQTFVSGKCHGTQCVVAMVKQRAKRAGYKQVLIRSMPDLQDWARTLFIRARNARRTIKKPKVQRAQSKRGRRDAGMIRTWSWKSDRSPRLGKCLKCRALVMSAAADPEIRLFHRKCWHAVLRSDEGRAWWSTRLALRKTGKTKADCDRAVGKYPSGLAPRGRPAENLTRDFGWAIRFLLSTETRASLATEAGVQPSAVTQAIQAICTALPDPALCDRRFRRYVIALRHAHRRATGAAMATRHGPKSTETAGHLLTTAVMHSLTGTGGNGRRNRESWRGSNRRRGAGGEAATGPP